MALVNRLMPHSRSHGPLVQPSVKRAAHPVKAEYPVAVDDVRTAGALGTDAGYLKRAGAAEYAGVDAVLVHLAVAGLEGRCLPVLDAGGPAVNHPQVGQPALLNHLRG